MVEGFLSQWESDSGGVWVMIDTRYGIVYSQRLIQKLAIKILGDVQKEVPCQDFLMLAE